MKKHTAMLLAALVLAGLIACGRAEASKQDRIERYLGGWVSDGLKMYITLEDDVIFARLTQSGSDCVWEFDNCLYDQGEDHLWCPVYRHYREHIDWETLELVQEDWSMNDLGFTVLAFGNDGDTLIASDIPDTDEPQSFRRVSDEAFFAVP